MPAPSCSRPTRHGRLQYPAGSSVESSFRGADLSVAQWVFDHGQRAGLGTDTLPAAPAVYLPLRGARGALGVLAVLPTNRRRVLLPEQRHLLETFAGQIALAWERVALGEEAARSRIAAESESLRNTLLASISHDLRTPLSVIAGAASTLARHGATLGASGPEVPRAVDRRTGAGDVQSHLERAGPDAPRVGSCRIAVRHALRRGPRRSRPPSPGAAAAGIILSRSTCPTTCLP